MIGEKDNYKIHIVKIEYIPLFPKEGQTHVTFDFGLEFGVLPPSFGVVS